MADVVATKAGVLAAVQFSELAGLHDAEPTLAAKVDAMLLQAASFGGKPLRMGPCLEFHFTLICLILVILNHLGRLSYKTAN